MVWFATFWINRHRFRGSTFVSELLAKSVENSELNNLHIAQRAAALGNIQPRHRAAQGFTMGARAPSLCLILFILVTQHQRTPIFPLPLMLSPSSISNICYRPAFGLPGALTENPQQLDPHTVWQPDIVASACLVLWNRLTTPHRPLTWGFHANHPTLQLYRHLPRDSCECQLDDRDATPPQFCFSLPAQPYFLFALSFVE